MADALGTRSTLAALLQVSSFQPTRWIDGTESPNSENARAIDVVTTHGAMLVVDALDQEFAGAFA